MRIGRGKIAGLAALILWTTVVAVLAGTGNDQLVLALVGIGIGASVLIGVHLALQMMRVRGDQRRANDRSRTVAKKIDGVSGSLRALERDTEETAARNHVVELLERLADIVEDHVVEVREDLAGIAGEHLVEVRENLAGIAGEHRVEMRENLADIAVALKTQLEAVQELRVDIEWLEQVLQGVGDNLARLGGHQPSDAQVERRPRALEDQTGQLELVQALQASVKDLTGLLNTASRTLAASPRAASGTDSSRRLNALVSMFSHPRYLEIGLDQGKTFEAIASTSRVGVEPVPRFDTGKLPVGSTVFIGTSDEFFEFADTGLELDVVFVDGLHTFQQTYRDIVHSLRHLRRGGVILVDDVVPCDEVSAIPDLSRSLAERRARGMLGTPWHGDVFRVVPLLRDAHPQLASRTIVGSGNEQLVLWNPSDAPVEMISTDDLAHYLGMGFSDLFADGIPEYFNAQREDDVISEFRSWRATRDRATRDLKA